MNEREFLIKIYVEHERIVERSGPEINYEKKEIKKIIKNLFETLTPNEVLVLKLKYGLEGNAEHKNYEIAKELYVTPARVGQIIKGAIQKLRHPLMIAMIETPADCEEMKKFYLKYLKRKPKLSNREKYLFKNITREIE